MIGEIENGSENKNWGIEEICPSPLPPLSLYTDDRQ
jgi:hypothetical protein